MLALQSLAGAALLASSYLVPAVLAAQSTAVSLPAPVVKFDHLFTGIGGVRELPDGSVLVSDAAEKQVLHLRPGVAAAARVGRAGAGPAEYGSAEVPWALSADTSLLPDPVNRRWHVLAGARFALTLPPDDPWVRATGAAPLAFDRSGNALALRRVPSPAGGAALVVESLLVVRIQRGTLRVDTLARLRARPAMPPPSGSAAQRNPMFSRAFGVPLTGPEQALLFPDGAIAIARDDPYRVEWLLPNGARVRGGTLDPSPVRVDDQEKRAYARRITARSGRPFSLASATSWPEFIGPFEEDALLAAPTGELVIRRQPSARSPHPRYDVIGRDGALRRQLALPAGARIVGFGARTVFVATTDEDGFQRLSQHEWQ